jgi:CHAD domain-containing protein
MQKTAEYLETLPEHERGGLHPLMERWRQKRTLEMDKLIAYLDSEDYQRFKKEFNRFTAWPAVINRHLSENPPGPDLVKLAVPVMIYTRLGALRARETLIQNAAVNELHALRIETKKLRYALEFFHEVLGEETEEVIAELKIIQDHLGNLNDANVACQILSAFLEVAEAQQNKLPLNERQSLEPVVAFLAARHAERHHLMVTFPKIWKRFNRRENLRNIALSISGL